MRGLWRRRRWGRFIPPTPPQEEPIRERQMPTPQDWCYIHDCSEPLEVGDNFCFECNHVFKPGELAAGHNTLVTKWGGELVTKDEEVLTCPHCTHDL